MKVTEKLIEDIITAVLERASIVDACENCCDAYPDVSTWRPQIYSGEQPKSNYQLLTEELKRLLLENED